MALIRLRGDLGEPVVYFENRYSYSASRFLRLTDAEEHLPQPDVFLPKDEEGNGGEAVTSSPYSDCPYRFHNLKLHPTRVGFAVRKEPMHRRRRTEDDEYVTELVWVNTSEVSGKWYDHTFDRNVEI